MHLYAVGGEHAGHRIILRRSAAPSAGQWLHRLQKTPGSYEVGAEAGSVAYTV